MRRPKKVATCHYRHDATVPPDPASGQPYCVCGARRDNPRHDMPAVHPDQTLIDLRRTGEREDH